VQSNFFKRAIRKGIRIARAILRIPRQEFSPAPPQTEAIPTESARPVTEYPTTANIPDLFDRFDQYETSVNLALRDLLKPGDVFFDVGANLGGLSVTGSRAVGPFGQVISFEVSPRIIPQLMANLRHWNANNVFVIPNAVWNCSGDVIELFFGGAHYADTVYSSDENAVPDRLVKTVSLDDVVETLGRAPSVVKMDIEGAELEALKGFKNTINAHHPALILEANAYVPADTKPEHTVAGWLVQHGYSMFDADNCQPFTPSSEPSDSRLINIICIHKTDMERVHRYESVAIETVKECTLSNMQTDAESVYFDFGEQPAGRYMIEFAPADTALDDGNLTQMATITGPPWMPVNYHHSHWNHLSRSYKRQPFHLDLKGQVIVRFKDRPAEDLPHMLKSISLKRLMPNGPKATGWPKTKFRL